LNISWLENSIFFYIILLLIFFSPFRLRS